MTDHMEQVIARLEKATGPDRELDGAIWCAINEYEFLSWDGAGCRYRAKQTGHIDESHIRRWTASIDAALTLVPDGFAWTLGQNVHHHYWQASVNNLDDEGRPQSIGYSGLKGDPTPALALCIAALKARQSLAQ